MKTFKYQLHTHTAGCSKCGRTTPEELAKGLYEGGYSGCVLTNHFYGGNTIINREIGWESFVRAYEADYLACKEAAKKYDLDIIFGIEQHNCKGKEILAYGITPQMLYDHPELMERNAELWYKTLHALGVLVIQAHPYRKRDYIADPTPLPIELIDGIEVYNAANLPEQNAAAEEFAKANPHLILTSGADTHTVPTIAAGGIEANERIKDGADLIRILKSGEYTLIKE